MDNNTLDIKQVRFQDIEEEWNRLYQSQSNFTVYQSYDYLKKTGKGFLPRRPFKAATSVERTYLVKDKTGTLAVLAGLKSGREISFRGMFTGAGNLDFVYRSDMTQTQFDEIFTFIKNQKCKIVLDRVSEYSQTYLFCKNSKIFSEEEQQICVNIQLPDEYEVWHGALTKSVRQNIRTSYNRMNTDGKTYEFNFFYEKSVSKASAKEMVELFSRRSAEYKHLNRNLSRVMRIVKESDPVVRYMMNGRAITYSLVRIDGKLAAAMCGFLNQDGSWVLPKLAINMDFSRYSPGGILINESIKYIYENQIPITNVDLSRGEERYKYIYGGKQHLNYRFIG